MASRDLRVKRTISISLEGSNALATMSETDYDDNGHSDPTYFSHLNVKRNKSHHYKTLSAYTAENGTFSEIAALFSGAVPAAIQEFDYVYDANYKDRGISSLLTESRQLDPVDNSVLSKSQVVYDNQLPAANSNYPAGYSLLGYS